MNKLILTLFISFRLYDNSFIIKSGWLFKVSIRRLL